ncbi:MAG: glutamate-5-semialdehyde dehydrogenase [Candidatus Margulisiibacteriota bacterium]|jgi:glutamate-5-semialdehyde dehydrogenase
MSNLIEQAKQAQAASYLLNLLTTEQKNKALQAMAEALRANQNELIRANQLDVTAAKAKGIAKPLLDRLELNDKRIKGMADGLRDISSLHDPVGEILDVWTRPNGLTIKKIRVPFGVIAIIYESRPNVTADAIGLCFKTNNAVVLRGGSDAINSNKEIVKVLKKALVDLKLPAEAIQLIESTEREAIGELLQLKQHIDLVIPRGGAGLIKMVEENSLIPVIETGTGNCHVYVDDEADFTKAIKIVLNSKVQRPSVCNAAETLLVHEQIAENFLPLVYEKMCRAGVELRACPKTLKILPDLKAATEDDWSTEYLDLIMAVKVVNNVDEAIAHIRQYGTKHTESIVTEDQKAAEKFCRETDASTVMVNASTRFTDGGEFGFGAEIGISTQKLHARGPMGLREITSYKYIVEGNGQVRE